MKQTITVKNAIDLGSKTLRNSDSNRLDAEIILGHVLNISRNELYCSLEENLDSETRNLYENLILRRKIGTPVAYLTGTAYFWSLEFLVTEDVLVPRPESELLVENAIRYIKRCREFTILDLGTGSGAIAGAIASECPETCILAVDANEKAAKLAQTNFDKLNLENINCVVSDWNSAIRKSTTSLIVANPPYVAENEAHLLDKEVWMEPKTSIFAKDKGLADIKTIVRESYQSLEDNGRLLIEHGYRQGEDVRNCFIREGFSSVITLKDHSLHDRVTLGEKPLDFGKRV